MTTYELTMGQIQTAEKHLALIDGTARRSRSPACPTQLPAHARAQLGGPRRPAASRRHLSGAPARPGPPARPWVSGAWSRRSSSDEARAAHGDPCAVPDPALQRAGATASTCGCCSSPSAIRAAAFYELHRTSGDSTTASSRARSFDATGAGSCSTAASCASCGGSARTRSPSAAGTSRPSGSRSRTAARGACRCSSGSSRPHATRAPRRAARARARAMVRGAAGSFVPVRRPPTTRAARRPSSDRAAPNAIDAAIFEPAAVDRSGRNDCTFLYAGRSIPRKASTCCSSVPRACGRARDRRHRRGGSRLRRLRATASVSRAPSDRDELVALLRATPTCSSCRRAPSLGAWC